MRKEPDFENVFFGQEELKRRKNSRILMKGEDITARFQGEEGFASTLIVDPSLGFNNRILRMWVNKIKRGGMEQNVWKMLGHRHTVEAIIYIKQGAGYSVIDGKHYDWKTGDFICVPYFAWHRHVNTGDEDVHFMACVTRHLSLALGVAVYEDERYPEYWVFAQKGQDAQKTLIPGGTEVPAAVGPPPDVAGRSGLASRLYEEHLHFAEEEEKKRRAGRVLVRAEDIRLEETRMGNLAFVVDPRIGFHVKAIATLMAEIPPGGKSGAHRHIYEEIDYVLSGNGYSIIEDVRYDWKAGDALSIPVLFWHQHFNTGGEPARFLVHTSRVAMENLGHAITQQGESAS